VEAKPAAPAEESEPREPEGRPARARRIRTGVSLDRLGRGFEALRNRNYRIWWLAQLVSATGTWMQSTAQAWLVLQLTHSPLAIGLVAVFQFFPVMVLALVGGVIADRLPRYRLVLVTQTLSMILAAVFGALVGTGLIQLWQVYLIAFLGGLVTAVDAPARQTFAIDLVDRKHRANAVALNSMLFNASRIVGPALAGLLIGPLGISTILYVNAASFLAVLLGLLRMDTGRFGVAPPRGGGSLAARLGEGLRYVRGTPEVLRVLILVAAIGTFGYNFSVTLPLIGGFLLHTDAAQYGGLGTALGVGSLVASVVMAYTRRIDVLRLAGAAAAFAVLLGAVALTSRYGVAAGLLVALGFAGVSFSTAANTFLQLRVPDELRGRVMSVYSLLFMGSTPVGGLLIGGAAHAFGVADALLLCAGLCLVGVAGALFYGRRDPVAHRQQPAEAA
jgi:MFS family permease